MIRINLAPPDELENPLWWLMDVSVLLLIGFVGYMGVQLYLNTIRDEIVAIDNQRAKAQAEIDNLKTDVEKHDKYFESLKNLNETVDSIRGIAISRVAKYRQVIIMEHLQTLKPQGMWFQKLNICNTTSDFTQETGNTNLVANSQTQEFSDCVVQNNGEQAVAANPNQPKVSAKVLLEGSALDNILIAEFLTALIATQTQERDDNDLRTQVVFQNVNLKVTQVNDNGLATSVPAVTFRVIMDVQDREPNPTTAQQLSWLLHPEKMLFKHLIATSDWR